VRSFVESRENQRWLWHATDHKTGKIPAHTFGKRSDGIFPELMGNVSNADVLWNNILNQNIRYGLRIRIWDTANSWDFPNLSE